VEIEGEQEGALRVGYAAKGRRSDARISRGGRKKRKRRRRRRKKRWRRRWKRRGRRELPPKRQKRRVGPAVYNV
jgi:hypothetical protein